MKIALFIDTNIELGAGIERTAKSYIEFSDDKDKITLIQTDFLPYRRMKFNTDGSEKFNVITLKDYAHKFNFLYRNKFTLVLYKILIFPLLIPFLDILYMNKLRIIKGYDAVYLFKNEYNALFSGYTVGSAHAENFYRIDLFNYIRSKLINNGMIYHKINTFHIFPGDQQKLTIKNRDRFIVPNGIDTSKFFPAERSGSKLSVLFVGRLQQHKGLEMFIDVYKKFENDISVEFHVAGSGDMEKFVSEIKKDNFFYHKNPGDRELAELYRNSDIFLFPSRWESYPIVVLEAISSGNFVILLDNLRGTFDEFEKMGCLKYTDENVESIIKIINDIKTRNSYEFKKKLEIYEYMKKNFDERIVVERIYGEIKKRINENNR
ncbi:MAG: glycosyltransferase family 4 protein [Thermoplasmata archaeon]